MTLALLQELLMGLRANDAYGHKTWLAHGTEQLGRDVAAEVESDWMVPLLVEELCLLRSPQVMNTLPTMSWSLHERSLLNLVPRDG